MRVGDPLKADTLVGSLVYDTQLAVVERYVAEGRAAGAHLLTGGDRLDTGLNGRFFQPTVFTDVTAKMSIATDEIFGPVLSVLPYDTLEEAIGIANSTSFGLSAGIWSNDINEALTAARDLRAGTVWVNRWMDGYPEVPFGGYGHSGIGRELGRQAGRIQRTQDHPAPGRHPRKPLGRRPRRPPPLNSPALLNHRTIQRKRT